MSLNIGVCGAGYWGHKVIREYTPLLKEKIIDSVHVCDLNVDLLSEYKNNKEITNIYTDFDKMLNSVDAVHICTNNRYHYPIAKAAVLAGKHVLVEKPMTDSATDAYHLVDMASSEGAILQVGHIFRFSNAIRMVKQWAEKGYFGEIYYFKMRWTTLMKSPNNVDIIWDLLPHPLDILNYISGEWPQKFMYFGSSFRREELNEVAFVNAQYKTKKFANIELSWLQPGKDRVLEIIGSERSAIIDCVGQKIKLFENGVYKDIPIEANNTINAEILHFVNSINNGKNPLNNAIIGARTVEMIERVINNHVI